MPRAEHPPRVRTWSAQRVGGLVFLLLLLAAHGAQAQAQAQAQHRERSHGEYVAILGNCIACHTQPGGAPFAGGARLPTPLGDIIAPNITPSAAGIGDYSLAQFDAAVRRGIRADGKRLYPAMPYTSYARVSDEDIAALYDWFMQEVEASDYQPPPTELTFPFNIRLAMVGWNLLFHENHRFTPDPEQTEQWNRGAYLVDGLAHCGACHTPRNLLLGEDASRYLAGGAVGSWDAPDITSHPQSGIGDWSVEELVQYLQSGSNSRSQAAGPMAEVVDHSLRYASEEDLSAIAVYLQTVPASSLLIERGVHQWGEPGDSLAAVRGEATSSDTEEWTGPQLFDGYCAACHQASGQGTADGAVPALYRNTATGRTQSNNLALVILEGIQWTAEGRDMHMPGFAGELTDRQVATLSNYLISMYGNPDATVTIEQVQALRDGTARAQMQPDMMRIVRLAVAAGFVLVLLVVWLALRRKLIRT